MTDIENFLKLFFYEGEYACFGLNMIESSYIVDWQEHLKSEHINLFERVSLNPLVMNRQDSNVTSFRNFMIESDTLTVAESIEHIKLSGIPFSCCVFSGNKSMHFYICLEEDIGDIHTYKFVGKWILNILGAKDDIVDNCTFTPSRMARLGYVTNNKTGKKQSCKIIRKKIPNKELEEFLLKHLEFKPIAIKKENIKRSTTPNVHLLNSWTYYVLKEGIYSKKKNNTYYQLAHNFYEAGFDEQQCFDYICKNSYNIINGDFSEKELRLTIASAYKKLLTTE